MPGSWEIDTFRRNRVLVATIAPPDLKVTMIWTSMIRTLQLPPGSDFFRVAGLPFGPARNVAAKRMIEGGYGYLFFLDSDTIPPANIITELMASGRDLIGGLYYQRFPPYKPAAYMKVMRTMKDAQGKDIQVLDKMDIQSFTFGTIIPCDFVPTGAMLISRRCMEMIMSKYPRPFEWSVDIDKPGGISEDYDMCLKAASLGFQPYLHTGMLCRHEIQMVVTSKGVEDQNVS